MYIVDDKVYEKVTSDLFTVFKEVEVPTIKDITPEFHGKPIPMSMWHDIMHCMKQTQDKFKSEALVFLFYDTKAKQPWSWWLPPQQTNGTAHASCRQRGKHGPPVPTARLGLLQHGWCDVPQNGRVRSEGAFRPSRPGAAGLHVGRVGPY